MENTLGMYLFPRILGQLELVALGIHLSREINACFEYSLVNSASIKTEAQGVTRQTTTYGPLRGSISFPSGERIDIEGIHTSNEFRIEGLRSSYGTCSLEGMRPSLREALEQIGTAIKTYF
ncbi:hypothetical protein J4211_01355 [Candidatus Woesearchaeota archaeon]|nr:hypothetical protein [uncultured archaeon]AQS33852.1 hypothetical protein [uncultured archaeon]MBS3124883.1 hypothetical protein [Candidatus Woesearchaeota archaeon]